jgi:hypothetical protein
MNTVKDALELLNTYHLMLMLHYSQREREQTHEFCEMMKHAFCGGTHEHQQRIHYDVARVNAKSETFANSVKPLMDAYDMAIDKLQQLICAPQQTAFVAGTDNA